jgi:RNA polymerase sigma-70 factor, ECF subfamily
VPEVARELGVPQGTIKARLIRGRAALAALLTDDTTTGREEGASRA